MSKKWVIIIGAAVFGLVLLYTGTQAYSLYTTPLGPALELATETSVPPTLTPLVFSSAIPPTQYVAATATVPQPVCGGPPVMNILLIGSDARGDHYLYGLSDVMRLVRVDFVTPRVSMLEFPRDLWVEIPEISDHYGITHGKLNQAYLYGNPGLAYYDGRGQGPELLALFKRSKMYDPTLKTETFIFDVDFNALRDYITKFDQGEWPPSGDLVEPVEDEYICE